MALDLLVITVYLDGENIEITVTIDPGIVTTPLCGREHNINIPFSLKTGADVVK